MLISFMLFITIVTLAFVIASVQALARWQGWWRWLAAAPLLLVSAIALKIIADTSLDPTSHNLWPFELLAATLGAGVLLGILLLVRLYFTRLRSTSR